MRADLEDRLAALEHEVRRLRNSSKAFKAELSVLRSSGSEELARTLRRSLINEARTFLEAEAGPRLQGVEKEEPWDDYVDRIYNALGVEWFAQKAFPISCFVLLSTSTNQNASSQPDTDATHHLRTQNPGVFRATYLLGLSDEERGVWEKLYNFLSRVST
ncbi:hypothetical protein Agub_g1578 [Astrephomene gubernaculifera]|uniref:Uncharacterized protein n=1 Tax=Astrephomene gubernaculifera TaxID=47775 RepID=A0AAD3DHP1_9CHLO|nr:hypothetical protein Agub_g1578 [Astrephomene gubernaculifera]